MATTQATGTYRSVQANDDTGLWEVFQHCELGSRCWLASFENETWARQFAAAPALAEALRAVVELRRRWREDENFESIDYMDDLNSLDLDAALAAGL